MKRNLVFAVAASALALTGCFSSVLDFRNAEVNNGKIYEAGKNAPFSGQVTNVPGGALFGQQLGLQKLLRTAGEILPNGAGGYVDKMVFGPSVCDITTSKGLPDGAVACKVDGFDVQKFEGSFSDGQLDGRFKVFDLTDQKGVVIDAKFAKGQVAGTVEVFNPATKKLITRSTWANGQKEGEEELFYPVSGNRRALRTYQGGKLHGTFTQYSVDGKTVIGVSPFVNGEKDGVEEFFYPETGKPYSRAEWKNGVKTGRYQTWDASGTMVLDQVFVQGQPYAPADAAAAEAAAISPGQKVAFCIDRWSAAFHKQNGEAKDISPVQLFEWRQLCDAGKEPE